MFGGSHPGYSRRSQVAWSPIVFGIAARGYMNVFVLCTVRCGSVTFAKACSHVTNFSSAHESRAKYPGRERISYPPDHIEVDNRLSWFLGRVEERYGASAYYVHLTRDREATALSFNRRWHMRSSIMRAYAEQICMTSPKDPLAMCRDYVETVTSNIRAFLRDKPNVMHIELEHATSQFPGFWRWIKLRANSSRRCPSGVCPTTKVDRPSC
jgi:hypothetical protein